MSSLAKPMATKLIKLVIYGKVNTPMNHYVSPTTWSHDKKKNKKFLPPEDVLPPKWGGCWRMVR